MEFVSHSAAETETLGEGWGRVAGSGWVFGLSGDLGAGKTQLVKGIARGLGITARVHSPTFNLVNVYSGGRLPLFHLDLYRLETPEQIRSAGLEDYLAPAGVTVVEWVERLAPIWGPESCLSRQTLHCKVAPGGQALARCRRVTIEVLSENDRRIVYEDFGD